MMQREKPGGHTERSIAIGTIEVACWDAVAKIEDKPLHRVLAERYNGGRRPGQGAVLRRRRLVSRRARASRHLQDEIRRRLDEGYTTMKIKVGGATIPEDVQRIEAALEVLGDRQAARGRRERRFRARARARLCVGARAVRAALVRGADRSARLRAARRGDARSTMRRSAPARTSSRRRTWRTSCASAGLRADRDILQIDVPQSYGIVQFSRTLAMLERHGWNARIGLSARRQPDDAAHRRRLRPRRLRSVSRTCSARSRASRTTRKWTTAGSSFPSAPASASKRRTSFTRSCASARELTRERSTGTPSRPRRPR